RPLEWRVSFATQHPPRLSGNSMRCVWRRPVARTGPAVVAMGRAVHPHPSGMTCRRGAGRCTYAGRVSWGTGLAYQVRSLVELPGVTDAVEEAREACTQLRWHPALRRRIPEAAAESRVRGATATALLEGSEPAGSQGTVDL